MTDIEIKSTSLSKKELSVLDKLNHEQNISDCGEGLVMYFSQYANLFNKMVGSYFSNVGGYCFNNKDDISEILKKVKDRNSYLKETDEIGNTSYALILGIKNTYDVLSKFKDIDHKFFLDQENIYGQSLLFIMAKYNIKDLTKIINDGYVSKEQLINKDINGHSILFYISKYHSKEFNILLKQYRSSKKDNIIKKMFGQISIEEVLNMKQKKTNTEKGYANNKKVEKEIDKLIDTVDVSITL